MENHYVQWENYGKLTISTAIFLSKILNHQKITGKPPLGTSRANVFAAFLPGIPGPAEGSIAAAPG